MHWMFPNLATVGVIVGACSFSAGHETSTPPLLLLLLECTVLSCVICLGTYMARRQQHIYGPAWS